MRGSFMQDWIETTLEGLWMLATLAFLAGGFILAVSISPWFLLMFAVGFLSLTAFVAH